MGEQLRRFGQFIYVGGHTSIIRMPAAGGLASTVTATPGEALAASRDGRSLYFVHERNGTALMRLDLDSKKITQVVEDLVPGCTNCWAVANDGVYYLTTDKQSFEKQILYFHDFATNRDRVVMPILSRFGRKAAVRSRCHPTARVCLRSASILRTAIPCWLPHSDNRLCNEFASLYRSGRNCSRNTSAGMRRFGLRCSTPSDPVNGATTRFS